ncbi:helix-turn-helix domain-containing protein [Ginsengibacter hankyongi]|uniref:Helix-turn-helix domain-containing protein n=1 Tax=Ginsengibacter hankyongi TaxID=2607284 RepID=A0A5J5IM19_9BACT|nr:helix-turn-helix domain-containing protein [Ginsengibacter hankyongi]KAA9042050.1 helix-turn-helix domain-containing protein [Ginsengibacter hankyongi]
MNETPMLFPIAPSEYWKQIKIIIEDVIAEKLNQQKISPTNSHLPEKALLKAADVCEIFQVSKPTLYEWLKQKKLKSFKIKSRRYFNRADIDALINSSL